MTGKIFDREKYAFLWNPFKNCKPTLWFFGPWNMLGTTGNFRHKKCVKTLGGWCECEIPILSKKCVPQSILGPDEVYLKISKIWSRLMKMDVTIRNIQC